MVEVVDDIDENLTCVAVRSRSPAAIPIPQGASDSTLVAAGIEGVREGAVQATTGFPRRRSSYELVHPAQYRLYGAEAPHGASHPGQALHLRSPDR